MDVLREFVQQHSAAFTYLMLLGGLAVLDYRAKLSVNQITRVNARSDMIIADSLIIIFGVGTTIGHGLWRGITRRIAADAEVASEEGSRVA